MQSTAAASPLVLPDLVLPGRDCPRCPRLVAFREANRAAFPDWHNGPVPPFGGLDARLLIVGLAPGLRGANRTARPFTGDFAGDTLYGALLRHGFARGAYGRDPSDGLELVGCRITNAVRCVPPENKPTPAETHTCRPFLVDEIAAMPNLSTILALGSIAHSAVLKTLGQRLAAFPFKHGARYPVGGLTVADSYHCSRYNTNTGRLTIEMFDAVIAGLRDRLA